MNNDVFDVLEAVLADDESAEYRVVEKGGAVEIRVSLYQSLKGAEKLPISLRERLTLTFDGDVSVLTLKKALG